MYTYRAERHDVRGMGSCKIRTANARSSITRPSPDLALLRCPGTGRGGKGNMWGTSGFDDSALDGVREAD